VVIGNGLKIEAIQNATVAKPKKIINSIESVPKVNKKDESTAGSFLTCQGLTELLHLWQQR